MGDMRKGITVSMVSDIIPSMVTVRELQIQASPYDDNWQADIILYIAQVSSESPTNAEIMTGNRILPFKGPGKMDWWHGIGKFINERYSMGKTLKGAEMRFAILAWSNSDTGFKVRVSILYEV